ncbi:uncharacterized protein FOMMEDRAFT_26156 [Fomitiporia mediterranea MF3/22]|uniref:uncharacterized protein n=1 Tax=Fomitiporia mediterranea (strain MF3/22) TaxID=694068 RepID=UPI00044099F4|nr:uncharacterized protein FOMMEDRAFT_26156 [Fomitiporia mediterranea MF3/22]EJD07033.1 hypothetical protein FOMMEDRAFT_26156 [Fomitiporia mediterranea MF3/22]
MSPLEMAQYLDHLHVLLILLHASQAEARILTSQVQALLALCLTQRRIFSTRLMYGPYKLLDVKSGKNGTNSVDKKDVLASITEQPREGLGLKPRGNPQPSMRDWRALASPAGGTGSGDSGPVSARTSFTTQRLTRRGADEFGAARIGLVSSNAARDATSSMGSRSDSGPAIGSVGVTTSGRGFALASSDELTSAVHASSWEISQTSTYTIMDTEGTREVNMMMRAGYQTASEAGARKGTTPCIREWEQSNVYKRRHMWLSNDGDDVVRLVGAGGILSHPVSGPSSPNSLSGVSIGTGLGVPSGSLSLPGVMAEVVPPTTHPWIFRRSGGRPASAGSTLPLLQTQFQDPRRRCGASVGSRHTHHRHYPHVISSRLAQTPLNVDRDEPFEFALNEDSGGVHVSRNTSSVDNIRRNTNATDDSSVSGVLIFGQGSTSLKVDDEVPDVDVFEEDDSGSEEDGQLIVRRRRPSEHLACSQSRVRPETTQPLIPSVEDDTEAC